MARYAAAKGDALQRSQSCQAAIKPVAARYNAARSAALRLRSIAAVFGAQERSQPQLAGTHLNEHAALRSLTPWWQARVARLLVADHGMHQPSQT